MSILTESAEIQRIIDSFQWRVVELDEDFSYYYIFVPDMSVNPMPIQILRRKHSGTDEKLGEIYIDFLDILLPCRQLEEAVEAEHQLLINTNAPKAQVEELNRIKELFGF